MDTLYYVDVKAVLLMIVVQSLYAVVNIMLKLVANDGKSLTILVAYRFIFASAFIVPVALFFERKSLKAITRRVLIQAFLCGLFGGSLLQNMYLKSMTWVSATYATAMLNLIPAVTYIMAVSLGLEKANLGTTTGKAKLVGTITGIGGAMIFTFYRGKRISNWSTHVDLSSWQSPATTNTASSALWGYILALATCLSYSLWLIVQAKMSEKFPWHYSIAALTSTTSSIQSVIFALCTERDWSQWKLDWNLRLLVALSSGILASGVCYVLLAWCVRMKGPLFASAFSPLMLVLVALVGSLVLDEYLDIGSVTGGALIVCGLYILLWGKSNEKRKLESEMVSLQCDPIHITNLSLSCNLKENDKKIVASVIPNKGVQNQTNQI